MASTRQPGLLKAPIVSASEVYTLFALIIVTRNLLIIQMIVLPRLLQKVIATFSNYGFRAS